MGEKEESAGNRKVRASGLCNQRPSQSERKKALYFSKTKSKKMKPVSCIRNTALLFSDLDNENRHLGKGC